MSERAVFLGALRERRVAVVATAALLSLHQVCEAAVPMLVGLIIDQAVGADDAQALILLLGALAALFVVLSYSYRFGARIGECAELVAGHELRLRVTSSILRPLGGAEQGRLAGDLASVAGSDATRVGGMASLVPMMIAALFGAIAGGILLLEQSLLLGLIVLGGLPLLLLAVEQLGRPLAARAWREQAEIAAAGATAADLVTGLRPLKGIGGEAAGRERYELASGKARTASIRAARAQAAYQATITGCTMLLLVAVAFVGGRQAASGELSLGGLIAAVGLTQFLISPLSQLGWIGAEFSRIRAAARRIEAVLAAPTAIGSGSGIRPPQVIGRLELRDVSDGPLRHLSIDVFPGELLGVAALEPEYGTTLVSLLAREHDPVDGDIHFDGIALADFEPEVLRASMLVAPHEATLFGGTLRAALLAVHGREDRLGAAIAAAVADDVVTSVPGGLDGVVSDRGLSLSGGQRQRVGLARALCAEPTVLVLHEPTTAVDAATEARIASGVRDLRRGRTTILITTSPALLAVADRVIVLDDAAIEMGKHEALIGRHPRYREAVLA